MDSTREAQLEERASLEAQADPRASREAQLEARASLVAELFGYDPGAAGELRGRLLRTREVALLFQVSERAVTDWARKGRIVSVRTPGGHRRYPAEQVRDLLRATGQLNGDDESS